MAWKLFIGGLDYSQYADFPTWRVSRSNKHRGARAVGRVVIPNKAMPRPKGFQQVILQRDDGTLKLFGGVVVRVEQELVNPDTMEYTLQCSDYTIWLDHLPVGGKVYNGTADAIVKSIIADYVTLATGTTVFGDAAPSVPITTNNVEAISVELFSFAPNYIPVSQAIDQLAKMVNAVWFVDENADLWFRLPDATALRVPNLPVTNVTYYNQDLIGGGPRVRGNVTEALPTIDADQDTNTYYDLVLVEDVATLITGVTVKDYYEVSTERFQEGPNASGIGNNEKLVGDGFTRFYPLYNQPVDPPHTKVTLSGTKNVVYSPENGNLKEEYKDGRPEDPGTEDWCFVCSTNKGIRFNLAPPSGTSIQVDYNYYFPSQDFQKNIDLAAEVADREGFGPGMYYAVLSDAGLTSPITLNDGTTAWLAAERLHLNRHSRIKILASFKSRVLGWKPGQIFAIVSTKRGDTADRPYNVWGQTFRQKFWVTQVTTRILNDTTLESEIEAASDIWGT